LVWGVCLILLGLAALSVFPDEPKQDALTAKQLLDRMSKAYADCKTYRDSGVVTTLFVQDTGNRTVEKPFKTAFVRPDQFRFEYKEEIRRYIIWSKRKELQTWWDVKPGIEKPGSLLLAVAGATGVSSGSAARIPAMLMPDRLGGWGGVYISGAKRIEDGKLEKVECFCVEGKYFGNTITLWVDKKSYLVRRVDEQAKFANFRTEQTTTYDPVVDGEITDKMLEFDPPKQR
jgi:outer membrane lipoprotein-sorting protein